MGIHIGVPRLLCDPKTCKVEYIGPVVNTAVRITAMAHGGQVKFFPNTSECSITNIALQVIISEEVMKKIKDTELANEPTRFAKLARSKVVSDNPKGTSYRNTSSACLPACLPACLSLLTHSTSFR